MLVSMDQTVEYDQELPGAGDHGATEALAGLTQSLVQRGNGGIVPGGSESGHVQDDSDAFSSAADEAFAAQRSAVVVEGSQTDERGDAATVDAAQLRQLGH